MTTTDSKKCACGRPAVTEVCCLLCPQGTHSRFCTEVLNSPPPPDVKTEDLTIAAIWSRFSAIALPDVSDLQRHEMQKAFYAGFVDCFTVVASCLTPGRMSNEQAAQVLEGLQREGDQFFRDMFATCPELSQSSLDKLTGRARSGHKGGEGD